MLCKIAGPDEEAEPLVWTRLGSEQPGSTEHTLPNPARALIAPPAQVSVPTRSSKILPASKYGARVGETINHVAALQKRLDESEAQRQAETQQALKEGLERGFRQGREEAATEMQGALDRLARTIQDVAQVKRKARHEAEAELVKLSLAIAKRILHREVSADPESMRGIVYAALQRLQTREVTRIRVYPAAVQAVRSALERNGGSPAIEIIPDPLLQPGGVLFETALGELDASVETQLLEIERGFADRLRG